MQTVFFGLKSRLNTNFKELEAKNDSVYFNSFFKETLEIELGSPNLENKVIKGNFVISSKDSIVIRKNNVLEDVIIKAPKVTIEAGFEGTIQVLATERIFVGKETKLNYPSTLCLLNENEEKEATVFIDEDVKMCGLILAFGNDVLHLKQNNIELGEKFSISGTIYCLGTLTLKGSVFGSVFASKLLHKTTSASYANCLADVTIDITQKPKVFIDFPIFNNKNQRYGIVKKVL